MIDERAPELSFVIPVRNDASNLRRCLETIFAASTGVEFEIIVADNGSTDDSADIARKAGAIVLSIPGETVAVLRNAAADVARADLLAFVDADHELEPGWSAKALTLLQEPRTWAVGAQYRGPKDGTWVQRMYDRLRRRPAGIQTADWIPSGNIVVRRDAFTRVGGFDTTLETCEDVDLCQRIRLAGGRLVTTDGMGSIHRGDPKTLRGLFLGELWRGRDNLRVSLRVPLTLRSMPSIAIPLLNLSAMAAVVIGLACAHVGGLRVALMGAVVLAFFVSLQALFLVSRRRSTERAAQFWAEAVIVSAVYQSARALALISRTGHDARRKK